jgi:hypothetical protein
MGRHDLPVIEPPLNAHRMQHNEVQFDPPIDMTRALIYVPST